ncbi:hypothetical protein M5K25_004540 [Dendrobium thyrsiflorum]|uniref:Uncharacterized protein n=1 Tax=Dendrobium thyrsiflorum TaxID=117978 RepID=A0ABD0VMX2_DENTH
MRERTRRTTFHLQVVFRFVSSQDDLFLFDLFLQRTIIGYFVLDACFLCYGSRDLGVR